MNRSIWNIQVKTDKDIGECMRIISTDINLNPGLKILQWVAWLLDPCDDLDVNIKIVYLNLELSIPIDLKRLLVKESRLGDIKVLKIKDIADGYFILNAMPVNIIKVSGDPEYQISEILKKKKHLLDTCSSSSFMLTVPQFNTNSLYLMVDITRRFLKKYHTSTSGEIWRREEHKDGNYHIHGLIETKKKITFEPNIFSDYLNVKNKNIHVNVQITNSENAVTRYISKHIKTTKSNDIIFEGKYKELRNGIKGSFLSDCISWILNGKKRVEDIINDPNINSTDKLKLLPKLTQYLTFEKLVKVPEKKSLFKLPAKPTNMQIMKIWKWLKKLIKGKLKNPSEKHMFIIGPTRIGKSTFVKYLQSCFKTYSLDNSGWFTSDWRDDYYDLAICDEFSPLCEKSFATLNLFLRGTKQDNFQVKNGSIKKCTHIPCLFLTNYPKKMYTERDLIGSDPFFHRFELIQLDHTMPLPEDFRDYYHCSVENKQVQCELEHEITIKIQDFYFYVTNDICLVRKEKFTENYIDYFDVENSMNILNSHTRTSETEISTQVIMIEFNKKIHFNTPDVSFDDQFVYTKNEIYGGKNIEKYIKKHQLFKGNLGNPDPFIPTANILCQFEEMIFYYLTPYNHSEDCCICFNKGTEQNIILPCGHSMHYFCWEKWVVQHGIQCVLCRREFELYIHYFPVVESLNDVKFLIHSSMNFVKYFSDDCLFKDYYSTGIGICNCTNCLKYLEINN